MGLAGNSPAREAAGRMERRGWPRVPALAADDAATTCCVLATYSLQFTVRTLGAWD
jgi:hypothetical protein